MWRPRSRKRLSTHYSRSRLVPRSAGEVPSSKRSTPPPPPAVSRPTLALKCTQRYAAPPGPQQDRNGSRHSELRLIVATSRAPFRDHRRFLQPRLRPCSRPDRSRSCQSGSRDHQAQAGQTRFPLGHRQSHRAPDWSRGQGVACLTYHAASAAQTGLPCLSRSGTSMGVTAYVSRRRLKRGESNSR